MSRLFSNNSYTRTVEDSIDSTFLLPLVQDVPLKFRYSDVSFADFSRHYSSNYHLSHCLGRKIIALPRTACLLVLAIADIALAIFVGIPKAFLDNGVWCKARLFSSARDIQGALGSLISLVHDQYGLYLAQQAEFERECYRCSTLGQSALIVEFIKQEYPEYNSDIGIKKLQELSNEQFVMIFAELVQLDSYQIGSYGLHVGKSLNALNWDSLDYSKLNRDQFFALFFYGCMYDDRSGERIEQLSEDNFRLIYRKFIEPLPTSSDRSFVHIMRGRFYRQMPVKYISSIEDLALFSRIDSPPKKQTAPKASFPPEPSIQQKQETPPPQETSPEEKPRKPPRSQNLPSPPRRDMPSPIPAQPPVQQYDFNSLSDAEFVALFPISYAQRMPEDLIIERIDKLNWEKIDYEKMSLDQFLSLFFFYKSPPFSMGFDKNQEIYRKNLLAREIDIGKRLADLSETTFRLIFQKFIEPHGYPIRYPCCFTFYRAIPEKHINQIDLTKVEPLLMVMIFKCHNPNPDIRYQGKRMFQNLPIELVLAILPRFPPKALIDLVSDEQLQNEEIKRVYDIWNWFFSGGFEEFQRRFCSGGFTEAQEEPPCSVAERPKYLEALGLDPTDAEFNQPILTESAKSRIVSAYRHVALRCHPDKLRGASKEEQDKAAARWVEIEEAKNRLLA